MQQKETTHKPDQEQALQDLWLRECAETEELQKISGADAFDAFTICFKLRKWNAVRFCEITGLSQTIFSKIKNKSYKDDAFPSLQSVVAICVGLQTPLDFSIEILNHCGYSLTNSKRDRCYKFILTHYERFDIDKANEFLIKNGFDAISDRDIYKNKNFALQKNMLSKSA